MTVQFRAVARRALTSLLLAGSLAAPPADARDFASDAAAAGVPGGALGRIEDGRLAGVETYATSRPTTAFSGGRCPSPWRPPWRTISRTRDDSTWMTPPPT